MTLLCVYFDFHLSFRTKRRRKNKYFRERLRGNINDINSHSGSEEMAIILGDYIEILVWGKKLPLFIYPPSVTHDYWNETVTSWTLCVCTYKLNHETSFYGRLRCKYQNRSHGAHGIWIKIKCRLSRNTQWQTLVACSLSDQEEISIMASTNTTSLLSCAFKLKVLQQCLPASSFWWLESF